MGRAFGAWVSEKATVEIAKQGAVKFVIACMAPIAFDTATVAGVRGGPTARSIPAWGNAPGKAPSSSQIKG